MRLRVHFKTPDAVEFAIKEAFRDAEVDPDSGEKMIDGNTEQDVKDGLAQWIKYGECVALDFEIDFKCHEPEVVPVK